MCEGGKGRGGGTLLVRSLAVSEVVTSTTVHCARSRQHTAALEGERLHESASVSVLVAQLKTMRSTRSLAALARSPAHRERQGLYCEDTTEKR